MSTITRYLSSEFFTSSILAGESHFVNGRSVTADGSAHLARELAYVVFRLSLGINMLIHGSGRFLGPDVEEFSSKTTIEFAATTSPAGLVHAFLTVLPFAEFILGGLITLGLFTRWAFTDAC
jgi:uncharacterized membrane protein YphA (DoxX/SURF4 family)